MNSSQAATTKYVIYAKFEVDGLVEKPDVVGAIFGQTEGLFGADMDLRELQKSGRVSRIEIEMKSEQNKTTGVIVIPSSLDRPTTALLAAAVEAVDRVGPYTAKVVLDKIMDARETKRKVIIERAKELLQKWTVEVMPSTGEFVKEVSESIKPLEVGSYGPEGLPAGPEVGVASAIIIVEGRADVANLMRCGYKNVIALEGARVPETIIKLSRERETTAFVDGDRSGEMILRELLQTLTIDFVARAPRGKEVEELTPKEVIKALRERIPIEQLRFARGFKRVREEIERAPTPPAPTFVPKPIIDAASELKGTLEAVILSETMEKIARIPVSELAEKLLQVDNAHTVVFDGVITQRLVDVASQKGVKTIIAERVSEVTKRPTNLQLLTFTSIATGEKKD